VRNGDEQQVAIDLDYERAGSFATMFEEALRIPRELMALYAANPGVLPRRVISNRGYANCLTRDSCGKFLAG
jgi:hypothetical protein